MTGAPWRAALRMAVRDATRYRARSALVVALIGLPVAALTAAAVVVSSYHLSPTVAYARTDGAASADLRASPTAITQNTAGTEADALGPPLKSMPSCTVQSSTAPCPTVADATHALGSGARVVERSVDTDWTVATPAGLGTATLTGLDYVDPIAAGVVHQLAGRAPRTPSEVTVTPTLAAEAHLHVGSTLRAVEPDRRFVVVGIASDATSGHVAEAWSLPAAVTGPAVRTDFLARTPAPVTWADVRRLDALGWLVQSRFVTAHPPPAASVPSVGAAGSSRVSRQLEVSGVLLVGMALLEVVLLAGPAFAVVGRRQERSLALVAAVGGRARDLRNAVLAEGVLLGGVAGVAGIAVGTATARLAEPLLAPHASHRFGPFTVRPAELVGVLAVSLATAVAAAVMPARAAARVDVVAALAGRRPRRPARARVPVAAVLVAGVGVLVGIAGAGRDSSQSTVLILAGIGLVEVGLIVATPTILLGVTRIGRYLPLGPRLALRDAGRNRSSAAPAVAAVMAAVIGCVAVLLAVSAQNAMDRRTYQPEALPGEVTFYLGQVAGGSAPVVSAMRSTLPTRSVAVLGAPGRCITGPPACPLVQITPAIGSGTVRTTRYAQGAGGQTVVAGPGALPALTGVDDPVAGAALRAGHAVVTDAWAVRGGVAALQVETEPASGPPRTRTVDVPAVAQTSGFAAAEVILPPSLAARLGVGSHPDEVVADDRHMPTGAQQQALRAALGGVLADHPLADGTGAGVPQFHVESGWHDREEARMLLLLLAAAAVAVAAAAIATGLSNSDRAEDLAVLEAVGGSGRTRRIVSVSRAAVIAGTGVILGTAAGFVPALGWIASRNRGAGGGTVPAVPGSGPGILLTPSTSDVLHLTVPWAPLAAVVLGIPLAAAVVAGTLSRTRLPSVRPGSTPG